MPGSAVMLSSQFRDVVEPVLNKIFDGRYAMRKNEWEAVFDAESGIQRRFHEEPVLVQLGVAQEKDEGSAVIYDSGGEAYKARYIYKVYGLAYAFTEELVDDGEHISLGRIYAQFLANSHIEAEEIVHVNILNNGFDSNYPGGDGKELFATDHPLAGGGTFSNELDPVANLSEAALEQLLIQVRQAKDERGNRIALNSKCLVVPPELEYDAERIVNSALRSGTGDNDLNAIRSMGKFPDGIKVMTRLTNSNFFGIKTDAPRGLMHFDRYKIRRKMEGDFETGNMRYKATKRYAAGWTDPRGMYASQGL